MTCICCHLTDHEISVNQPFTQLDNIIIYYIIKHFFYVRKSKHHSIYDGKETANKISCIWRQYMPAERERRKRAMETMTPTQSSSLCQAQASGTSIFHIECCTNIHIIWTFTENGTINLAWWAWKIKIKFQTL